MIKVQRSDSIKNLTSYGMKCLLETVLQMPAQPCKISDIQKKYKLRRNDMINIRRQILKINQSGGSIRFIEPDRTHIVYIEDCIVSEKEVTAILAAASAMVHLQSNVSNVKKNPTLEKNLSNYIYELITT
ncbi:hypothetical protein [Thalassotalea piscium]|uniref:Uncharacterized protein n=1 Tax=Thalassotalea piscium TaxID=1230533 RepID=A0A7X0NKT9_9GAMM|nr:hypothetical protein [Thalassotalea piscium]MBB6545136.1 hypothetical protein [Thalassotalea piscium]